MAERRQLRTSEGLEGRSECPATGHGQPDPRWTLTFPSQKQIHKHRSSETAHLVPNRIAIVASAHSTLTSLCRPWLRLSAYAGSRDLGGPSPPVALAEGGVI
jgi:hypothetical protein